MISKNMNFQGIIWSLWFETILAKIGCLFTNMLAFNVSIKSVLVQAVKSTGGTGPKAVLRIPVHHIKDALPVHLVDLRHWIWTKTNHDHHFEPLSFDNLCSSLCFRLMCIFMALYEAWGLKQYWQILANSFWLSIWVFSIWENTFCLALSAKPHMEHSQRRESWP